MPKRQLCTENLDADAVEMEGAAVAQICWQHNVPCLVIRSLSDNAGAKASEDFKKYYKIAARNSAALVTRIISQVHSEQSTQPEVKIDQGQTQGSACINTAKYTESPMSSDFKRCFRALRSLVTSQSQEEQESGTLREEKYTIHKSHQIERTAIGFSLHVSSMAEEM